MIIITDLIVKSPDIVTVDKCSEAESSFSDLSYGRQLVRYSQACSVQHHVRFSKWLGRSRV